MGFFVFLFIALIFAGFIFINVKMNNLKYRAKQQILKDTGISSSNIDEGFMNSVEKKTLERFLGEHPEFTEESIKKLLEQIAMDLVNKNQRSEFCEKVCEKMQNDSKLEMMRNMEFKRININYYKNSIFTAIAVFTDNKDEQKININCSTTNNEIRVDSYQIVRGAVVGF